MAGKKTVKDKETGEWKVVPRQGPPRRDTYFRRLEDSIEKDELLEVLDASTDERAHHLMLRMLDPVIGKRTLPQLAKEVGLSYAQVLQLITRHNVEAGILAMARRAPKVLEDVAIDSESKEVKCGQCKGTGEIDESGSTGSKGTGEVTETDSPGEDRHSTCFVCDGTGTLRKVGDEASRKLMFETLKLTGRGTGPQVQVNVGSNQTMEDTIASVRDVLDVKAEPDDKQS
jgi:hypothetical protein